MKKLITILPFLLSLVSFGQTVETVIAVPYTSNPAVTRNALLYKPSNYASTTTRYPVLFFGHGAGEGNSANNLSLIYNSSSAGGPAYYMEHSLWPSNGFLNPLTGNRDTFIVVTPQASSWSYQTNQWDYIVQYIVNNYRVDTNRMYMTGLSAGGAATVYYVSRINIDASDNITSYTPRYKMAAIVPLSAQISTNPPTSWSTAIVGDSVRTWGGGSLSSDIYGEATLNLVNHNLAIKPGIARFNDYAGGHCCWNTFFYNPSVRYTVKKADSSGTSSMNIYEWLSQFSRVVNTNPTSNAGSDQTIALPTSSVTLTGTATAGSGFSITSTTWSKVSGGSASITSASSLSTTVTGLSAGTYVFRLSVTNSNSVTATDDVTITVNQPITVANAGSDQTITLPTASVTLNGTGSTGNITSYLWTRVSGANTPTITAPTSATTTVTGLIAGVYVFQLSCNNGASTDQVQITVNNATPTGGCSNVKRTITPFSDSTAYMTPTASMGGYFTSDFKGGDTLVLGGDYTQASFVGLNGSPGCPITIINPSTGQTTIQNLNLESCTYIKVTGTGKVGLQYGFLFQKDPVLIYNTFAAIKLDGRSRCVEFDSLDIHHTGYGFVIENNGSCDTTWNYPNFVMDSIIIHDNRIIGTWNQGMYIGNTQPDNAKGVFDDRLVICNGDSTYPRPMRNGYTKIYNNIVDSTGRGGIQLSGASSGISEIYNNIVKHSGLNGDEAQGGGIIVGKYTHAYIHHNTITNTYTYGVESEGASGTNIPLRVEDNRIDSSGYLITFDLSQAPDSKPSYNPNTEPTFADTLTYPRSITLLARSNMDGDSALVYIIRDTCGIRKNATQAISIENIQPFLQKSGHIICSNVNATSFTAAPFTMASGISYITTCGGVTNILPTSNAGSDKTITLPTSSVTLIGSGTDPDGTIVAYAWSKTQGGSATIVSATSATTVISGLTAGTYVFRLQVTDNGNGTGIDDVTVVVNPAPTPGTKPIRGKGKKLFVRQY